MTPIALLLDEMYPSSIAVSLRSRGHDVQAVHEIPDLVGRTDDEVLAWATKEGRVVVTENVRDFIPLASGSRGASIGVWCVNARRWPRTAARRPALVDALDSRLRDGRPPLLIEWL